LVAGSSAWNVQLAWPKCESCRSRRSSTRRRTATNCTANTERQQEKDVEGVDRNYCDEFVRCSLSGHICMQTEYCAQYELVSCLAIYRKTTGACCRRSLFWHGGTWLRYFRFSQVCTSSPAVEQTIRSLARDIQRPRSWTRSLFCEDVQYVVSAAQRKYLALYLACFEHVFSSASYLVYVTRRINSGRFLAETGTSSPTR
jgi:hypothetical protein